MPALSKPAMAPGSAPAQAPVSAGGSPADASQSMSDKTRIVDPMEEGMIGATEAQKIREKAINVHFQGKVAPLGRAAVMKSLSTLGLKPDDIYAMGPVGEGRSWQIVTRESASRDSILAVDHLPVNAGHMRFTAASKVIAKIRIHWLPLYVPDHPVACLLRQYGTIEDGNLEKSVVEGMSDVCTGVRSYVLCLHKGVSKEDIPFTGSVSVNGENFKFLCTVQGRTPRCLRCRQSGHIKSDCENHLCKRCNAWTDHMTPNCPRQRSYAGKVGNVKPADNASNGERTEELQDLLAEDAVNTEVSDSSLEKVLSQEVPRVTDNDKITDTTPVKPVTAAGVVATPRPAVSPEVQGTQKKMSQVYVVLSNEKGAQQMKINLPVKGASQVPASGGASGRSLLRKREGVSQVQTSDSEMEVIEGSLKRSISDMTQEDLITPGQGSPKQDDHDDFVPPKSQRKSRSRRRGSVSPVNSPAGRLTRSSSQPVQDEEGNINVTLEQLAGLNQFAALQSGGGDSSPSLTGQ